VTLDRSKPPDLGRIERARAEQMLSLHQRRMDVEVVRQSIATQATIIIPPFSYPGGLAAAVSPPWSPSGTVTATAVRALLGTAGTTTTTVSVRKNGSSVGTVSLVSSDTDQTAAISGGLTLTGSDLLTVEITAVGAGAQNLTVVVA
jgi:hypothetical protein